MSASHKSQQGVSKDGIGLDSRAHREVRGQFTDGSAVSRPLSQSVGQLLKPVVLPCTPDDLVCFDTGRHDGSVQLVSPPLARDSEHLRIPQPADLVNKPRNCVHDVDGRGNVTDKSSAEAAQRGSAHSCPPDVGATPSMPPSQDTGPIGLMGL